MYQLIANVGKNQPSATKGKTKRSCSGTSQNCSSAPMNMNWTKIFTGVFIFPLSVSQCSKVTGSCPPLNDAAAARPSLSIVYPKTLPIPLLCGAVRYICYITVTEQRAVFTCVAAGACHSCKVIKYACIKMSCVNRMNLGSLLRAPLFNQW